MIDPDDVLDWLEDHMNKRTDSHDQSLIQELVDDFNQQWDTRDSPMPEPNTARRKKKKPRVTPPKEDGY